MIKIYGKPNCPYCTKAKKLVESLYLDYEYIDVSYLEKYNELKELVPHAKTVPQIFRNGIHLGGYTDLAQDIENCGSFGQDEF